MTARLLLTDDRLVVWSDAKDGKWLVLVLEPSSGRVLRNLSVSVPAGVSITDTWVIENLLFARVVRSAGASAMPPVMVIGL